MSIRVGLGLARFPFAEGRSFFRWARQLDEAGVDSLWQTDRLVSSQPFVESMSAMAALAGATERIKFGMNAVVVSVRDPLVLAKQCASVDYLSGGRLLPAFGVGADHAPEFRATDHSARRRGRRADELLELMRRLWSEERVSFEGEFFHYRDCTITPRPVQQPLPLWIGGHSRAAIARTARVGTGWIAGLRTPAEVAPIIEAIRAELRVTGRRIADDHYGAGFGFRFGSWDDPPAQLALRAAAARADTPGFDPRGYYAVGEAADIALRCRQYIEAGVSKFVLIPLADSEADVFAQSERLVAEVLPRVEDR